MADLVSGQHTEARQRALRELIFYFVLTFVITFGLGAIIIFFQPEYEAAFGPIGDPSKSWLYFVAVSSPTISAVLVSLLFGGLENVKTLFAGLYRPFRLRWMLVSLLTIPAALLACALAERYASDAPYSVDLRALVFGPFLWFTTRLLFTDPGPWGEETGWRGFALPRLLTRFSPLMAAIVLGAIWSTWHTPAFFVSGLSQHGLNFVWFMTANICLTIFMTWIYVNGNRNYLIAGVIPHAVSNLMFIAHAYNDIEIEAIVYMAIALLIVAASGPSLRGWRFGQAKPTEL
ncbi:MAG TPA: CPBP family intramembrane glutamic endopeptidase [Rhizomicrobium sp.]|nr:CPBP family intramembrane glutamic endopeptidase [Rhizomicrobium sp.]